MQRQCGQEERGRSGRGGDKWAESIFIYIASTRYYTPLAKRYLNRPLLESLAYETY